MTQPSLPMILDCPACRKPLRIDARSFVGKQLNIRCPGCQSSFTSLIYPRLARRALLAHADRGLCRRLQSRLQPLFEQVDLVHDGQQALSVMGLDPPDVLLLDAALPGLFSFELIDRIHDRVELEGVRIVLLCEPHREEAYRRPPRSFYGADGYIELDRLDQLALLLARLLLREPAAGSPSASWDLAEDQIRPRLLRDVEQLQGSIDDSDPQQLRMLARLLIGNIARAQYRCIEDPLQDVACLEQLMREMEIARQVLSQVAPAVRRQSHDYIREAFEAYIRQRKLELSGAYYPGVEGRY